MPPALRSYGGMRAEGEPRKTWSPRPAGQCRRHWVSACSRIDEPVKARYGADVRAGVEPFSSLIFIIDAHEIIAGPTAGRRRPRHRDRGRSAMTDVIPSSSTIEHQGVAHRRGRALRPGRPRRRRRRHGLAIDFTRPGRLPQPTSPRRSSSTCSDELAYGPTSTNRNADYVLNKELGDRLRARRQLDPPDRRSAGLVWSSPMFQPPPTTGVGGVLLPDVAYPDVAPGGRRVPADLGNRRTPFSRSPGLGASDVPRATRTRLAARLSPGSQAHSPDAWTVRHYQTGRWAFVSAGVGADRKKI